MPRDSHTDITMLISNRRAASTTAKGDKYAGSFKLFKLPGTDSALWAMRLFAIVSAGECAMVPVSVVCKGAAVPKSIQVLCANEYCVPLLKQPHKALRLDSSYVMPAAAIPFCQNSSGGNMLNV